MEWEVVYTSILTTFWFTLLILVVAGWIFLKNDQ